MSLDICATFKKKKPYGFPKRQLSTPLDVPAEAGEAQKLGKTHLSGPAQEQNSVGSKELTRWPKNTWVAETWEELKAEGAPKPF